MKKAKRISLFMVLSMMMCVQLSAADAVKFVVADGVTSSNTKKQIEQNVSALLTELREKGVETPYLRSRRIIGLILGASIVLGGVLPAPEKLAVTLPLLALVFIAVLACNRHFLGRFTPKKWF